MSAVTQPKQVTREEFLALFQKELHSQINRHIDRRDVLGVVCFENIDMSSSDLGQRSALIYGAKCTCKTLDICLAGRLGDVPSRFQYPKYYYVKP